MPAPTTTTSIYSASPASAPRRHKGLVNKFGRDLRGAELQHLQESFSTAIEDATSSVTHRSLESNGQVLLQELKGAPLRLVAI